MSKPILVLITLCVLGPALPAQAMERFALTVGHEYGTPGEEPLRFATRDARRMRDVLVKLGSVEKKNARVLENPDQGVLAKTIRQLGQRAARGNQTNMLFFYFAGHGDAQSIHLGKQKLSRETLLKWVNDFPAKLKVVIIDSCQTPSVSRVRGVRAGSDFDIGIVQVPNQQGTILISSSSKGEPAHESDMLEGAIFTHFMVSALLGSADVDHDGRISLQEAFTYSYRNTVRRTGKGASTVQHPSFKFDIDGSGEIVLTHPGSAGAVLVLPPQKDGSYLVFKESSGSVVAEVASGSKKPVYLAVPTGRLLVQLRERNRFQQADVNLPYGGKRVLKKTDFEDVPYEQTVMRGGTRIRRKVNFVSLEGHGAAEYIDGAFVPKVGPRGQYVRTFGTGITVGAIAAFTFANYRNDYLETHRRNFEFGIQMGKQFSLGVMDLNLSVGPLLHIRRQHRSTTLDKDRLAAAGLSVANIENTSVATGGALQAGLRVPLRGDISVFVSAEAAMVAARLFNNRAQRWTAVPSFGGAVGLGAVF